MKVEKRQDWRSFMCVSCFGVVYVVSAASVCSISAGNILFLTSYIPPLGQPAGAASSIWAVDFKFQLSVHICLHITHFPASPSLLVLSHIALSVFYLFILPDSTFSRCGVKLHAPVWQLESWQAHNRTQCRSRRLCCHKLVYHLPSWWRQQNANKV